mmetsp:Transcript_28640/g.53986  ORF Transcript_28640/g.53986 Transcript_28640/m.53986 type:complete len:276 (+) Transcript_28640:2586-3413(+)
MTAGNLGTAGHVKHVAHAQELFRAHFTENGTAVDFGGHLEGNPGWEVGFDGTGDHIHGRTLRCHNQVDTRGSCHLRQTLNTGFDLFARDHHQVRHLIDDHNDVGHLFWHDLFGLKHRFSGVIIKAGLHGAREGFSFGQRICDTAVVPVDVAHAHFGHLAIALFHLAHDPFESHNRLFGVGHNRGQQMRDAVIYRQFQHFRVNHDHAAVIRRQTIQQRQDHRVDRNGFTRTGGPCNQQVRHLGKVGYHGVTANIFAQRQRKLHIAVAKVTCREDFT